MRSNLRQVWTAVGAWGGATLVLIVGLLVAYQFVEPAPPDRIVFATGEEGGAYQQFGEAFAAYLAKENIQTELRPTAGSIENMALLDSNDGADVGFVQGGLADSKSHDNVIALGSLYLEPLWLFTAPALEIDDLSQLAGLRIAAGAAGSGTRPVSLGLLAAHGIGQDDIDLSDIGTDGLVAAFAAGEIDAAFVVGAPESEYVRALLELPGARLQSLDKADAYVRRFPWFSKIRMPAGVLDLRADLPAEDIDTIALTAMLAANRELHPALVDLLLVAAADIHGKHSLLADAGEFPTARYADLPLSEEASRHFKYGPPFLMRYLPFWAATLVDRLWVMLLPLIGLAVPLIKLVPPAYRWQIRRRILRLYAELEQIDPMSADVQNKEDLASRLQRLEKLDTESVIESVPRGYKDNVYKLRRDIDLVRRRLLAAYEDNSSAMASGSTGD